MKRIKPIKPIELQLVIEVEPYHWSDRATPNVGSAREYPEIWEKYFHQCMADVGIEGLTPIQPGSSFVDAFRVVNNDLILRMIRECLHWGGLPGFPDAEGREDGGPDSISALEGG